MSTAARTATHVPALDGLRGVAILLVLVCHTTGFGRLMKFVAVFVFAKALFLALYILA